MDHPTYYKHNDSVSEERQRKPLVDIIPNGLQRFFMEIEGIYKFSLRFLREVWLPPYEFNEVLKQCYYVGIKSFPLIAFTALLAGVIFTKQSRPSLESFGAVSWLPGVVSIAIVRSVGPIVTGLTCAGKLGSQIGAELGSMKVTEQIDAMRVSGTNPFTFLVITRVLGCMMMIPFLIIFADTLGLFGAFVSVYLTDGTSLSLFYTQVFEAINVMDLFSSIAKGVFFGFWIGIISCYKGFSSQKGTVGVGVAANSSVVLSMFMIFMVDLLMLPILQFIRNL